MSQFGGKDSKRHFTVIMGGKEHGLYVSSTPSSAAKKAVTKLCASNKSKKVEFHIREITQGSKKKTYGPYEGHIEKLKMPIELKGRVIKYKPVAKLSGKSGAKKGGGPLEDFKKNYNICIQKAKDKLEEMITNDEFVHFSLDQKNLLLQSWARQMNIKILSKFKQKDDEYSKKLVKNIEEGKITICIPDIEIRYEGDEYVIIHFLEIDGIISIISKNFASKFVNSNSNSNNNINSAAFPASVVYNIPSKLENHTAFPANNSHQFARAGPAQLANGTNSFFLGSAAEANGVSLENSQVNKNKLQLQNSLLHNANKIKNPVELCALIEFVKLIEEWKISWNSSKIDMFIQIFLKKFNFTTRYSIPLKNILLDYLTKDDVLYKLKRLIHKTISKNPKWIRNLKDNNSLSQEQNLKDNNSLSQEQKLNRLLKYFSSNKEIIVLPEKSNIYSINQKQKIPDYTNQNTKSKSKKWEKYYHFKGPTTKDEPENIKNYEKYLKELANELYKNLINWWDRSEIIERSVTNLLQKHYEEVNYEKINRAVKIVRLFLVLIEGTRDSQIMNKIWENSF